MKAKNKRRVTYILTAFAFLLAAVIFVFAASAYAVLDGKACYHPRNADVIIIPGTMGGSLDMRERCQTAANLYNSGYAKKIIATGAQGADERMTEAANEALYLKEMGVNETDIFLEEKSTSTKENLKYAKMIMDEQGFGDAIIATSDFHLYRCMQFAKRLGIQSSGAPAGMYEPMRFTITLREIIAVGVYAIKQQL
jgi:uncharacterized SAM-binding protein YcdF (DUF218 family)